MDSMCGYGSSCTMYASNSWTGGDPCPGTGKTLVWQDTCVSNWGNWGSWSGCPSDCTTQSLVRYRSCVKPGGGCGSAPADYISCLRVGCSSSSEISRYTPDDSVNYLSLSSNCFVLTGRTSYTFRVKAHNDVHMVLSSVDSYTSGTHYEVIICGWGNTRSTIRYSIRGSECVAYSATLLSQTYFDDFWVSWSGGQVKAGTGSTVGSNTFMTCSHSPSYEVNYILIKTGWGSTGDWRFPNDVACTHETNSNVNVATDDTSCNGVSSYACASSYKRAAGNTQRTCQVQKVWSGYPLICSVSTCKIDILFIIEASYYTNSIHSSLMTVIGDLVGLMAISTNDIQVGVITYDNSVDENIKLNAYSSATALDAAITSITIPSASSSIYIATALRVGFYDFVKLSNGNRFDAYRYFILIAKTYSSNYGRDVANAMRQNPRNQVFTIGISPSSSLISDLKLSAGDDDRYLQLSTPTDLYPHFNTFLQKIATCPATAPVQRTVSCKLDIAFIVENYNLRYIKRFVVDLMDDIPVSSSGVRVGFVIFDSGARTVFGLSNYTSNEALRGAIEGIVETSSSYHYVDKGLIEARDNVFTAAGGDRTDAPNYYVFVVGPFYRNTDAVARDVSSSGNNFIFAVHIGSSYHAEYQASVDSCGDYSKYTNINWYNNLVTIREQVIGNITTCHSVVETTPGCKLDIAFIMDDSTSVSSTEFTDMKSFFKSLVARIVVGDTTVRIGVVTFGDGAVTAFPLNQYSTSADVITGIEGISRGNSAYGRSYRYVDRALEYTQKSFFTKANGDRTDAANYYVVLTHGYSYGYKTTEFGSVLRSMTSVINDIFIVGVGITYSTYDADYQGAVSDAKKYIESSNFIGLQCINDMVVSNITTCPSASISPSTPVNPSCKLDIVFILETNTYSSNENYIYLKDFFSRLVQQIGVSSDTVRIGAIRYNSKTYTAFDLQTYTTSDDVSDALLQLSDSTDSRFLIDSALSYAQSTFFTAANGDRDDAANYYVFTIDGIRSGAAKQGELIAANWPDTVFAIDIDSGYATEYENTAGDSSRYFYAASYADLSSIESSLLAAITGCPVPTTTTTTTTDRSVTTTVDASLENADVSAPCPSSLLYLYPEDLTASNDGEKEVIYLMTDFVFAAPSCSRITSWEFSYSKSGWIDFMVWRPSGNKYKLVAYNTIYVDGANTTVYTVVEYERIAVLENDVIGWRCEGDNVITNGDCLGPCAEGFKASAGSIEKGDEFDWANLGTAITGTAYAIKACLEDNTVIAFSNSTFSAKIPDHLAVGSFVLVLEVTGVDYTEEVNFTALQHPSFTDSLQYFAVDQIGQIVIAKKLMKAKINKEFAILVEAKDSCEHSATATVSIETQNMPPEILDLPNSISISEETEADKMLYSTNVEDPTGDDVCCTLESVSPQTLNFNLTGSGSGSRAIYSIVSGSKPAFSYKDFNSYIVKVCCDDTEDKSTGVLIVNIKKPDKATTYEPPGWFALSVGVSCIPIFLMAIMSCVVLIQTLFALE
ncbi:collagen alpha-3(VI) chain-like [Ostrea edulis]|uniref:collagen alpha-3(VI) chain-like n=1 Tax=Ostrea edulis TaxID=37623 RepID=UPI0024AF7251|nr:collagen alpha-3(VI) chain-like [Ostrea edulis]